MDLPKLKTKMTLQNPMRSPDGGGGYITTWTDLGTHWAHLTYRTGRTASGETSPVARQPVEIILRATPPITQCTPSRVRRWSKDRGVILCQRSVQPDRRHSI